MASDSRSSTPSRAREAPAVYGETPSQSYPLVVAERGRLVLPVAVRDRLKIQTGDRLTLTVEHDGTMVLHTPQSAVARLRGAFKHLSPGRDGVDELIAERRREAAAEAVESRESPRSAQRKSRR